MSEKEEPMQKTSKGEEIPVPKREDFLRDLKRAAKPLTRNRRPKK